MNTDLDAPLDFSEPAEETDRAIFTNERARSSGTFNPAAVFGLSDETPERRDERREPTRGVDPFAVAAGLSAIGLVVIALVAIGALVAYQYLRESVRLSAKTQQIQQIAAGLAGLQARVDAIEADRAGERPVELRGDEPTAPAFTAAIAQIGARLDRVRDDANDHFQGLASRLDKLEANAATPPAVAPPVAAADRPAAATGPATAADAAAPPANPQHVLTGFAIRRIRDGVVSISGPGGEVSVSVGDVIPGAGRVVGISRHGRNWVVVTSLGIIKSAWKSAKAHHAPGA
jgi:hypothetical protein